MTEREEVLAAALQHLLVHYVNDVPKSLRKIVHDLEAVKQAVSALATVGVDPYQE